MSWLIWCKTIQKIRKTQKYIHTICMDWVCRERGMKMKLFKDEGEWPSGIKKTTTNDENRKGWVTTSSPRANHMKSLLKETVTSSFTQDKECSGHHDTWPRVTSDTFSWGWPSTFLDYWWWVVLISYGNNKCLILSSPSVRLWMRWF